MGGRASKPTSVILGEGNKDHRTKSELEARKNAEKALITGIHMHIWPEVKKNPIAKKEFNRVQKLLVAIGKDDALHESTVNRYALLKAECSEFEEKREAFYKSKDELQAEYRSGKLHEFDENGKENRNYLPASQYYKLLSNMQKSIIDVDKQIMSKRNMMFAIEKENLMTIASALRSIPKKPQKKEDKGGITGFMSRRNTQNESQMSEIK